MILLMPRRILTHLHTLYGKARALRTQVEVDVGNEKTSNVGNGKTDCGGIGDILFAQNYVPYSLELHSRASNEESISMAYG